MPPSALKALHLWCGHWASVRAMAGSHLSMTFTRILEAEPGPSSPLPSPTLHQHARTHTHTKRTSPAVHPQRSFQCARPLPSGAAVRVHGPTNCVPRDVMWCGHWASVRAMAGSHPSMTFTRILEAEPGPSSPLPSPTLHQHARTHTHTHTQNEQAQLYTRNGHSNAPGPCPQALQCVCTARLIVSRAM